MTSVQREVKSYAEAICAISANYQAEQGTCNQQVPTEGFPQLVETTGRKIVQLGLSTKEGRKMTISRFSGQEKKAVQLGLLEEEKVAAISGNLQEEEIVQSGLFEEEKVVAISDDLKKENNLFKRRSQPIRLGQFVSYVKVDRSALSALIEEKYKEKTCAKFRHKGLTEVQAEMSELESQQLESRPKPIETTEAPIKRKVYGIPKVKKLHKQRKVIKIDPEFPDSLFNFIMKYDFDLQYPRYYYLIKPIIFEKGRKKNFHRKIRDFKIRKLAEWLLRDILKPSVKQSNTHISEILTTKLMEHFGVGSTDVITLATSLLSTALSVAATVTGNQKILTGLAAASSFTTFMVNAIKIFSPTIEVANFIEPLQRLAPAVASVLQSDESATPSEISIHSHAKTPPILEGWSITPSQKLEAFFNNKTAKQRSRYYNLEDQPQQTTSKNPFGSSLGSDNPFNGSSLGSDNPFNDNSTTISDSNLSESLNYARDYAYENLEDYYQELEDCLCANYPRFCMLSQLDIHNEEEQYEICEFITGLDFQHYKKSCKSKDVKKNKCSIEHFTVECICGKVNFTNKQNHLLKIVEFINKYNSKFPEDFIKTLPFKWEINEKQIKLDLDSDLKTQILKKGTGAVIFVLALLAVHVGLDKIPETKCITKSIDFIHSISTKGFTTLDKITEWCGINIFDIESDASKIDSIIADYITRLSDYKVMPTYNIVQDARVLKDFKLTITRARKYLSTIQRDGSNHLKTSLSRLCEQTEDKFGKLREHLQSSYERMVPSSLLIYGEPAHGKTRALMELCNRVQDQEYPNSIGIYNYNNSNYYPAYNGQPIMRVEELYNNSDLRDDKLCKDTNSILSNGFFNFEGAAIEDKFQPCQIQRFYADSNRTPEDIAKNLPLVPNAIKGTMSRFCIFKSKWMLNPQLLKNPRGQQGHKQDFSHIGFIPIRLVKDDNQNCSFEEYELEMIKDGETKKLSVLTLEQLQIYDHLNHVQHRDNAKELLERAKNKFDEFDLSCKQWWNEPLRDAKAVKQGNISKHHCVINVSGEQGTFKSEYLDRFIDYSKKLFRGVKPFKHENWETTNVFLKQLKWKKIASPQIMIFDDAFLQGGNGLTDEVDERNYMNLYNQLPTGSLILVTSNIRLTKYWLPHIGLHTKRIYNVYHQLFNNEGMYRRLAFEGFYYHNGYKINSNMLGRHFESTGAGYSQLSTGKVFSQSNLHRFVIEQWQKVLSEVDGIILNEVVVPPSMDQPANIAMVFPSLTKAKEYMDNPTKFLMIANKGMNSEQCMFTMAPEVLKQMEYSSYNELVYKAPLIDKNDMLDCAKHFAKLFRKYRLSCRGSFVIAGVIEVQIRDTIVDVYYPTTNVHSDMEVTYKPDAYVMEFSIGNNIIGTIDLEKYYSLVIQEDKFNTDSYHYDIRILEYLALKIPYLPTGHLGDTYYKHLKDVVNTNRKKRIYSMVTRCTDSVKNILFSKTGFLILTTLFLGTVTYYLTSRKEDLAHREKMVKLLRIKEQMKKANIEIPTEINEVLHNYEFTQLEINSVLQNNSDDYSGDASLEPLKIKPKGKGKSKGKPKIVNTDLMYPDYNIDHPGNSGLADWGADIDYDADFDWQKSRWSTKEKFDNAEFNEHPPNSVEQTFNSIRKNLVKVSSNLNDGSNYGALFGIGIKERFFVTPSHIMDSSSEVKLEDERIPGKIFKCELVERIPNKELAIFRVTDKEFPSFKDITSRIIKNEDSVPHLRSRLTFCRVHKGTTTYHSGVLKSFNKDLEDYFSPTELLKDVCDAQFSGAIENISYFGDCGLPYIDNIAAHQNRPSIMGFHIGAKKYQHGITLFTTLYQDEIEASINRYKQLQTKKEYAKVPMKVDGNLVTITHGDEYPVAVHCTNEEIGILKEFETNMLNQNCNPHMIYKEEPGHLRVIGYSTSGKCSPPAADHVICEFSDLALECGIEIEKIPTKRPHELTPEEREKLPKDFQGRPCQLGNQTSMYEDYLPPLPEKLIAEIVKDMEPMFSSRFSEHLKFASDNVVLSGVMAHENSPYAGKFGPIELNASAGFTLNKLFNVQKKSEIFNISEDGKRTFNGNRAGNYIKMRYKLAKSSIKKGIRPFTMFKTCLKQERLPLEKAYKGRVFENQDTLGFLMERFVLGYWCAANCAAGLDNPCRIGIDPISGFDTLFRHHNEHPHHFSADYSRWDKHISRWLFEIVKRLFRAAHAKTPEHTGDDCAWCKAMEQIIDNLWRSINIAVTDVYIKGQGMPSGSYLTGPLNSLINDIVLYIAFKLLIGKGATYERFIACVKRSLYGDDATVSVIAELSKIFNLATISKILKKVLGLDLDSADKDGKLYTFSNNLSDMKFISRQFTKLENYNYYVGALKKESITSRIHWIKKKETSMEHVATNFNMAYVEASLWDEEFFSKFNTFHRRMVQNHPEFEGKLLMSTRTDIQRMLYVEQILNSPPPGFMRNTASSDTLLRDTINEMSCNGAISKVNEALQAKIITSRVDQKLTLEHKWLVKIGYEVENGSNTVFKTFEGEGCNLKIAKEIAYDKCWTFIKENLIPANNEPVLEVPKDSEIVRNTTNAIGNHQENDFEKEEFDEPYAVRKSDFACDTLCDDYWKFALNKHYKNNDHHPEHWGDKEMTFYSSLECMVDLYASALRIKPIPIEAFKMANTWFLDQNNEFLPKFKNLNKRAVKYWFDCVKDFGITTTPVEFIRDASNWRKSTITTKEKEMFEDFHRKCEIDEGYFLGRWEQFKFIKDYIRETNIHIWLVESIMSKIGYDCYHDRDKYKSFMIRPYVWQWFVKSAKIDDTKRTSKIQKVKVSFKQYAVKEMEVAGGGADPGVSAVPSAGLMPVSALPGPSANLEVDNQIDATGLAFSNISMLNTEPTKIMPDGVMLKHNYIEAMYAISPEIKEFTLTDKSKMGDLLFEISNFPDNLPKMMRDWLKVHEYAHISLYHKIVIIGTETLKGGIIAILVPDRSITSSFNGDRRRAPSVKLGVNGMITQTFMIPDVIHTGRVRKVTSDPNPWPAIRFYVYEQLSNPRQPTEPFSITIKLESWFAPDNIVMSPRADRILSLNDAQEEIRSVDPETIPFPSNKTPVSFYAETTNREILYLNKDLEIYPKIAGLFPEEDVSPYEISPKCIISCMPVYQIQNNVTVNVDNIIGITYAPILLSGSFPIGCTAALVDKINRMYKGEDIYNTFSDLESALINTLTSVYGVRSTKRITSAVLASALEYDATSPTDIHSYLSSQISNRIDMERIPNDVSITTFTSSNSVGHLVIMTPKEAKLTLNLFSDDYVADIGEGDGTASSMPGSKAIFYKASRLYVHTPGLNSNGKYIMRYSSFVAGYYLSRDDFIQRIKDNKNYRKIQRIGYSVHHTTERIEPKVKGPINIEDAKRQSNVQILTSEHKAVMRDPRLVSFKVAETNFSLGSPLDVPAIPIDNYGSKVIEMFEQIRSVRNFSEIVVDVRYRNTVIAKLKYDPFFGLSINPTSYIVALTNLDTNFLSITNIQSNQSNLPETETREWKPYFITQNNRYAVKESFLAGMAMQAGGGMMQGIGNAIDSKLSRDHQLKMQRNTIEASYGMLGISGQQRLEQIAALGMNQRGNINLGGIEQRHTMKLSGEINAILQDRGFKQQDKIVNQNFENQQQLMHQQTMYAGLAGSPAFGASGKGAVASNSQNSRGLTQSRYATNSQLAKPIGGATTSSSYT